MKNHSDTTSPLTVTQSARGADRNQRSLGDTRGNPDEDVLLPSLDDGITLLDVEGGRGVPIIQSLILDHLLLQSGLAFWVDAHGYATTTTLSRLSPSQRLLNRIHVSRGFTPHQHFGAVCDLPRAVAQSIQKTTQSTKTHGGRNDQSTTDELTPSVLVVPGLDAQYRDDSLESKTAETLQARVLARLSKYARGYDCPVLVTRSKIDGFTAPIETFADHTLACEKTRMGPRFSGEDFETLVYPVDGGAYYQTTFAYWRHVLRTRAMQTGLESVSPQSPTGPDTTEVGSGVLADGSTATLTASPLLDTWTDGGERW